MPRRWRSACKSWVVPSSHQRAICAAQARDVGYSTEDFWPGAMKAVTWDGVTYGIPTNNETMAFIWNADIFKRAASIRTRLRQPGTTSSNIPSRFTTSSALPVTVSWLARMPAIRRTVSCRSCGAMAAASSTKPQRARPISRSSSIPAKQGGAASLIRHVCSRQVGSGLGTHQPAGR